MSADIVNEKKALPNLTLDDARKMVEVLRGISTSPKCKNHQPNATSFIEADNVWVSVHCPNCGFMAVMPAGEYERLRHERT